MSSNQNQIVLEDGLNTDYIYSTIIALFYAPIDGINGMINNDVADINGFYVQEFIKLKFIYQLQRSLTIESCVVNKFRLFLHNCGWLRDGDSDILKQTNLANFYTFLISSMLEYSLKFTHVDTETNTSVDRQLDMIRITDDHLNITNNGNKIADLSSAVGRWIKQEILGDNISYKFEHIPHILPIYLDTRDKDTGLNKRYINIMEGLRFEDNGDQIQRQLVWDIHSMICQTEREDYYAIVIDRNDRFIAFSDKKIPSNWVVDMTDINVVKKVMSEVRFVFYKLQ
jgi:hypothetical protein